MTPLNCVCLLLKQDPLLLAVLDYSHSVYAEPFLISFFALTLRHIAFLHLPALPLLQFELMQISNNCA